MADYTPEQQAEYDSIPIGGYISMPDPAPQPKPSDTTPDRQFVVNNGASWLQMAAVATAVSVALIGYQWFTRDKQPEPGPQPPQPTVVEPIPVIVVNPPAPDTKPDVKPDQKPPASDLAKLPDSRIFVTKNGKTMSDDEAKSIKDAIRKGDGNYLITGYPDNAEPITKSLIIGAVGPVNPAPPGPGPTPDPTPNPQPPAPQPNPPQPTPDPTPAPIPSAGFRVMIVVENIDLAKLPKEQSAILRSAELRSYLDTKTVKGTDKKTPEWRIFDDSDTMANETELWRSVYDREGKGRKLPWLVVSNPGKGGYSGPLPATLAETMTLLKKYGD